MNKLRKRFIKDYNLPIQAVQDPYFEYLLDLYDPLFNCKKKYSVFLEYIKQFKNDEEYFKYQSKWLDGVVNHIKEKESFKFFNEEFNLNGMHKSEIKQKNIYSKDNVGKLFLSVDLKKANFQALKFVNLEIIDNCNTYEDFLRQFTDSQYLLESKHIRQVIFRNLNPKRQQTVQKHIISLFVKQLEDRVEKERFISASSGEIVIVMDPNNIDEIEYLQDLIEASANDWSISVNVSLFKLEQIDHNLGYVKKEYLVESNKLLIEDGIEFKAVSSLFMAQAFKTYFNQPIEDSDLVFYHEGHLAKFLQTVEEKENDN